MCKVTLQLAWRQRESANKEDEGHGSIDDAVLGPDDAAMSCDSCSHIRVLSLDVQRLKQVESYKSHTREEVGKQASHAETKCQPLARDKVDNFARLAWLWLLVDIVLQVMLHMRGHGSGLGSVFDIHSLGRSHLPNRRGCESVSEYSMAHYLGFPSTLSGGSHAFC